MMRVTHRKVSTAGDTADDSLVQASDWNDLHVVEGAGYVVGEVRMLAGLAVPPAGWLRADGALLPVADYPELAAALGAAYGGDGVSTFALPDFAGRGPRGAAPGVGGAEAVTIEARHVPGHRHRLALSGDVGVTGTTKPINGRMALGKAMASTTLVRMYVGPLSEGSSVPNPNGGYLETDEQATAPDPLPLLPPWVGVAFYVWSGRP